MVQRAFPEANVSGYGPPIADLHNDPKDRRVVAAALEAGASLIVTRNVPDFRELPAGLTVCTPDRLLLDRPEQEPHGMVEALRRQAAALRRPARAFEDSCVGFRRLRQDLSR